MSMLRRIFLIGGSGVLGAAALALVQIRVGSLFGVGGELDAFFVGAALPSVLLAIVAGTIGGFVVPRLPQSDPAAIARAAGRMAALGFLLSLPITLAIVVAAPLLVAVLAPGLDADVAEQGTGVLRIYALTIPGTAAAMIFASYGYAVGRVWASGLSTTIYALSWFALLFVPALNGSAETATLAALIATAIQLTAAFAIASQGVPKPWPAFGNPRISRAALVALISVGGTAIVSRAGLLLDPAFGSLLDQGAVSELSYAARIAALAVFVCGQGAAYSLLIVTRGGGGTDGRERAASETRIGLLAPLLMAASAAVVTVIGGPALAELLLARGELSADDAREIGELLRIWSPTIVATTLIWSLEMMLFADHRSGVVLRWALAALSVNVLASIPLVLALDEPGRPVAVLLGSLVELGLLLWVFRSDPRTAVLREAGTARTLLAHVAAVVALALPAFLLARELVSEQLAVVVLVVVVAAVTLFALRRYQSLEPAAEALLAPVPQR